MRFDGNWRRLVLKVSCNGIGIGREWMDYAMQVGSTDMTESKGGSDVEASVSDKLIGGTGGSGMQLPSQGWKRFNRWCSG